MTSPEWWSYASRAQGEVPRGPGPDGDVLPPGAHHLRVPCDVWERGSQARHHRCPDQRLATSIEPCARRTGRPEAPSQRCSRLGPTLLGSGPPVAPMFTAPLTAVDIGVRIASILDRRIRAGVGRQTNAGQNVVGSGRRVAELSGQRFRLV